jgi:hypothetical protein
MVVSYQLKVSAALSRGKEPQGSWVRLRNGVGTVVTGPVRD